MWVFFSSAVLRNKSTMAFQTGILILNKTSIGSHRIRFQMIIASKTEDLANLQAKAIHCNDLDSFINH